MICVFFDRLLQVLQIFEQMMSYESDARQRQSKKKIFPQQMPRQKIQERQSTVNMKPKISVQQQSHVDTQRTKDKHVQILEHKNKELSRCLKEQKEKYDQLFEEYEELIERNSLIEKQYLNLKYQHNKEVKNLKKFYKEKIDQELKKAVQEFCLKIDEECLWEGLKGKIDIFVNNLLRITQIFLSKSKKRNQNQAQHNKDPIQKLSKSRVQQITSSLKSQKSSILQIPSQLRIQVSPNKDISKQSFQVINSTNINSKQVIFQDEYYGDIQDYDQLQQKIVLRKNYELMKNVNRNSSSQIRRKKIFKSGKQFQ